MLEEAKALQTLERARHLPNNSPSNLAQIFLLTGLADGGLARHAAAVADFEAALRLDGDVAFPEGSSPRLEAWWEEARRKVASEIDVDSPRGVGDVRAWSPLQARGVSSSKDWLPRQEPAPAVPRVAQAWPAALWVGGALLGAGGAYAEVRSNALFDASRAEPAVGRAHRLYDTSHADAVTGLVLLAAGGAALLGGAGWFIFGS